jgi:transcriptional regulator with XRE-family HTH domain
LRILVKHVILKKVCVTTLQNILNGLAEVVRLRRSELNISQKELADKIGCGRNYIIEIEMSKNHNIPLARLLRLSESLNYPLWRLLQLAETTGDQLAKKEH